MPIKGFTKKELMGLLHLKEIFKLKHFLFWQLKASKFNNIECQRRSDKDT